MNGPSWGIAILIAVACFFVGGFGGCMVGVGMSELGKEIFDEANMVEVAAEIANPITLDRPGYSLKYPGNWTLDTESGYYDIDSYFGIYSPGGSYVEFIIEDYESDAQELLDDQLLSWEGYLANEEVSYFDTYGGMTGKGALVEGSTLGVGEFYRIFCHSENNKTVIIVEDSYDMDEALVRPGYELIASSLRLKE